MRRRQRPVRADRLCSARVRCWPAPDIECALQHERTCSSRGHNPQPLEASGSGNRYARSATDVLPVDQVWGARRSMQHGPAIANQAPHRHRQAKSGTYRGREPPHARHTCLGQPTADQGCVLRHGVDLGIGIDFGGLLNAAVGRRRLCNSSTQSSPSSSTMSPV
jgi:hypothetical protein